MRVVEEAVLSPGTCVVTGRSDGPFVDTGTTVPPGPDYRVYLKTDVVREAALKLGMVPRDELDKALAEVERLEKKVAKDQKAVEASYRFLGALDEAKKNKPAAKKPAARKKATA